MHRSLMNPFDYRGDSETGAFCNGFPAFCNGNAGQFRNLRKISKIGGS